MNKKKYAGPLPESAVTVSICDSCSTHTVALTAAMIISANARLAAPTLAGAYKPVAPKPLSAGRFGMVRITGTCGPNQRASAAWGMPAATEITRGRVSAMMRRQPQRHGAHLLRFDGEYHHLGALAPRSRCRAAVVTP